MRTQLSARGSVFVWDAFSYTHFWSVECDCGGDSIRNVARSGEGHFSNASFRPMWAPSSEFWDSHSSIILCRLLLLLRITTCVSIWIRGINDCCDCGTVAKSKYSTYIIRHGLLTLNNLTNLSPKIIIVQSTLLFVAAHTQHISIQQQTEGKLHLLLIASSEAHRNLVLR